MSSVTMDELMTEVVRCLQVEIVQCLDPTEYVLEYMLDHGGVTELVYKRILDAENRVEMNRLLVDVVKRKKIVQLFMEALRYKGSHTNLASSMERKLAELKCTKNNDNRLIPNPNKFDIKSRMNSFITKLHYYLKTLSHDGGTERFNNMILAIRSKYPHVADIQFYLLEAEFAKNRVFYQKTTKNDSSLREMERLVATTTNPLVCSMVYLARRGSLLSMEGHLEEALQVLELARSKAEFIQPCKDTGTVLYIHINLLLEHYESHPHPETKDRLIRDIAAAIGHFAQEPVLMREDYSRLFYLKMAFCYLGIGVFGKTINCPVTERDLRDAKSCLRMTKQIRGKFDKRRQMFYCLARSVLLHRRGYTGRAVALAAEAEDLARTGGFSKELGSIINLSEILHAEAETEAEELNLENDLLRDLQEMEQDNLLTSVPKEKPPYKPNPYYLLLLSCLRRISECINWIWHQISWLQFLF